MPAAGGGKKRKKKKLSGSKKEKRRRTGLLLFLSSACKFEATCCRQKLLHLLVSSSSSSSSSEKEAKREEVRQALSRIAVHPWRVRRDANRRAQAEANAAPPTPPPHPPHRLVLPVQSLSQQPSHHPHQPRAVRTRLQPQDSQPQSPAQKCSRRRPRAARHQARRSRSSTTLHGQATSSRCCWHPWPDGWVRRRSRARTLLLLPARAAKTMVGRPWRPLLVVVVVPVVARWAQGRL